MSLLVADRVVKKFGGGRRKKPVIALGGVSLTLEPGHIISLVGESGSGKTTLGRIATRLTLPTSGSVRYKGTEIRALRGAAFRAYQQQVQMVFQDPFAALNPVHKIGYVVGRPLINYHKLSGSALDDAIADQLQAVGLTPVSETIDKYPHQLSGGQRQRVVVARALAAQPELIVADEPVSMLDVSIKAGVLRLLKDLRDRRNIAYIYITHDLVSARFMANEIIVLYAGRVVERGPAARVVEEPQHPYTRLLLNSIPQPGGQPRVQVKAPEGPVPDRGCPFAPRCPEVMARCREERPLLLLDGENRGAACFLVHQQGESENPAG